MTSTMRCGICRRTDRPLTLFHLGDRLFALLCDSSDCAEAAADGALPENLELRFESAPAGDVDSQRPNPAR